MVGHRRKIFLQVDQLAPTNGFAKHDAFDALDDVQATIPLAKRIRKGAAKLWDFLLVSRDKKDVLRRLQMGQPIVLVENHFGRLKA